MATTPHSHHLHDHDHDHGHAPHAHPAQALAWSLMRMDAAGRLALAAGLSALLWLAIWGLA